jgi:2-dehydro-3-deoxygluconokinase
MRRFVAFGELLLRLKAPGHERLLESASLEATFGGAEANVAVSLAQFGLDSAFVSALPDNGVADAALRTLGRFGVDTSRVMRVGERMGTYYLEAGAGQRPSRVIYDRGGSSLAEAGPGLFDWPAVLSDAQWFHVSGITPAISASAAELAIDACRTARSLGVTVSCDLNFRARLWNYGRSAHQVMPKLVRHVDVLIAGRNDFALCLGVAAGEPIESATAQVLEAFPQIALTAVTLRESHSAGHHTWAACLRDRHGFKASRRYDLDDIVDRIGSGDAFAAGLIYALNRDPVAGRTPANRQQHAERALEFATAAACLKHSIPGDFNLVSVAEVDALVNGEQAGRVQR